MYTTRWGKLSYSRGVKNLTFPGFFECQKIDHPGSDPEVAVKFLTIPLVPHNPHGQVRQFPDWLGMVPPVWYELCDPSRSEF